MPQLSEWVVDLQSKTVRNANGLAVQFCHDDDLSADFSGCAQGLSLDSDAPWLEGWRPHVLAQGDEVNGDSVRRMIVDALKALVREAFGPALAA